VIEFTEAAQTVEFRLLILAFLILAGPIIAERVKVPGLIGLIFLGMVFGPFLMGWVTPDGLISAVGAVGLLYLMFLAGIELDINTFIANRGVSITFGLVTFAIPFGLSFLVGVQILGYTGAAAALVGAMWASHTLVAYTEVKSAGLEANRAVGAAVSATVITDVLALVILGFAVSTGAAPDARAGGEDLAIMPVWAGITVLGVFCMWLLPRATKWFFVHLGHSRTQRFIWTFGGMAAGAFLSLLGGIEGLVGAFLAGIGMNRLVPAHGPLMERIEFFGNALFVPAFLITVGLSIDPRALSEWDTIQLALIFVALVVVGKVLAAVISGLIFELSWAEIGMMASLTIGQAAATLAIAQVGVSTGLFSQQVINAAVIAVVVTVIITSVGTRYLARLLEPPAEDASAIGKHVLLQVTGEGASDALVAACVAMSRPDDGLLSPYVICDDDGCGPLAERLEEAVQSATDKGQDSEGISRVADSEVTGTLNLAVEKKASLVVLPWTGRRPTSHRFFGEDIDRIGARSPVPVMAARVVGERWRRVLFFQGRSKGWAIRDEDAAMTLEVASRIASHLELELVLFVAEPDRVEHLDRFESVNHYSGRTAAPLSSIQEGDLVVVPPHVVEDALGLGSNRLTRSLDETSLMVVGGPGRLRVSNRSYTDDLVGGRATFKRDRTLSAISGGAN
jgi:Kef-type K+ transport system membrane component KefB